MKVLCGDNTNYVEMKQSIDSMYDIKNFFRWFCFLVLEKRDIYLSVYLSTLHKFICYKSKFKNTDIQ